MKTPAQIRLDLSEVEHSIAELSKTRNDIKANKKELRKLVAKRDRLQLLLKYVESDPSEDAVRARLKELVEKLDAIHSGFNDYMNNSASTLDSKKEKAKYYKDCGRASVSDQIKNLEYILNI